MEINERYLRIVNRPDPDFQTASGLFLNENET